jgi:hypothetical protein
MAEYLLSNAELYSGKYVALEDFGKKNVIASGDDPLKVLEDAKNSGVNDPVVFFVPEKGMVYIYSNHARK